MIKILNWFQNKKMYMSSMFYNFKHRPRKNILSFLGELLKLITIITIFIVCFIFIIGLIILGPLAIIWALNTIFPVLAIPYNFWTWLAVVIICNIFKRTTTSKSSK